MIRQISSGLVCRLLCSSVGVYGWMALIPSRIVLDLYDKVGGVFIERLTQWLHFDTSIYLEHILETWQANLSAYGSWPTIC